MSIANAEQVLEGLPGEDRVLAEVAVRLIETEEERRRHDDLLDREHYLHNANAAGRVLRHVAEYKGTWVGILAFCSAALHLDFPC